MKLASAVAIAALEAAIKRLGISVSAKTLPITVAVELGHFLIEKSVAGGANVYDGTGAVDEWLMEFFKTLSDDTAVAEDTVWAFNKAIEETPSITHSEVFDFYKSLADTASAAEQYTAHLSKPLTDAYSAGDAHAYAFAKDAGEDITAIVDTEVKAFAKALSEAPSLIDAIDTVAFFKNTQDAAGFTDAETFAFAKYLVDTVGVTDDIDGAASILDDQEMQFVKNTTNVASALDTFIRVVAYTRTYADAAGATDVDTLTIGKNESDDTSFTDSSTTDFGKLLSDTPVVEDALALRVTLAPFLNSTGITDTADVVPNKVILDSTSLTDAGSLRSQGYSDFTYFAEDYVGASRTF